MTYRLEKPITTNGVEYPSGSAEASNDRAVYVKDLLEKRSPVEQLCRIHWHFNNPWAQKLTYVRVEDLLAVLPDHYEETLTAYGCEIDAYLLPQPGGRFSAGLRYGSRPEQYLSPYVDDRKAAHLFHEYTRGD